MTVKKEIPAPPKALYDYLASLRIYDEKGNDIFAGNREEWLYYIKKHIYRVHYVLNLIPREKGLKCLEVGASPYLITAGAVDILGLKVTTVSSHDTVWPGKDIASDFCRKTIMVGGSQHTLEEYRFNVEKDIFPFKDETFDLVLCNEIIEHLLFNPTHLLCEINRILSPGGKLILSTGPNMLYWRLAVQLLLNITIEMPYSGEGPYGRHNRLFTSDELIKLTAGNGFEIEKLMIKTFGEIPTKPCLIQWLRQATLVVDWIMSRIPLKALQKKAGENITIIARKSDLKQAAFPPDLYSCMYPEWLKSQKVHYMPDKPMSVKWIKQ